MILDPLTESVAIKAAAWRNATPQACRTTELSTEETQRRWFKGLAESHHKYWAVVESEAVGLAGLTNISWANRSAEISLVMDPSQRGRGFGGRAVPLLIDKAFKELNLDVLYGECYLCSGAVEFWHKVMPPETKWVFLPDRKWWNGRYWGSEYFSLNRRDLCQMTDGCISLEPLAGAQSSA